MSWIAKILPREEKFYDFIRQLSAQAGMSARHLKTFVHSRDTVERKLASESIRACKAEAKRISAETTRELCRTFITPFDREDIQDFASGLYRIPKTIDKVREYLEMHNVNAVTPQIDVIIEESNAMENMVEALLQGGKIKQIMQKAELLDQLENRGDEVLSGLLTALLRDTQDVRQLILHKDLYDMLEKVIDRYRNAAEVALQIALKNS